METDLNLWGRMLALADEAMIRGLIVWRDNLIAATNVPEDRIVFLVPQLALPGITSALGSQVIHADVTEPMVALAVPKLPV